MYFWDRIENINISGCIGDVDVFTKKLLFSERLQITVDKNYNPFLTAICCGFEIM